MADTKAYRLRTAKGRWMRLKAPDLLKAYMKAGDFSQARLARYAGCSRQFIWQLLNDEHVTTCTPQLAHRIEEAFGLLPDTLFEDPKSPATRQGVARKNTKAA